MIRAIAVTTALHVVVSVLLSAPLAALADPTDHPILVRASITESIGFTGAPPCFGSSTLRGNGQSASLGSFTVASQDCVNPLGAFSPTHPSGNKFAFASTSTGLVFTTGTGDRLYLTYSGNAMPQANRPHRLTGQFVVTGGTGVYFTATGGGIIFGSEDLNQVVVGQGELTVLGVIRY